MGLHAILGADGMYICDGCRTRLKFDISEHNFKILKDRVAKIDKPKKCYICNQFQDQGLFIEPILIVDALEKVLANADKMESEYKVGNIICTSCGATLIKKSEDVKGHVQCDNCNMMINIKHYEKNVRLPMKSRLALKLYIKYIKGGIKSNAQPAKAS